MCGIAGIIQSKKSLGENPELELRLILSKMMSDLKNRGPDGQGMVLFEEGEWLIGLAHTRLSIIDLQGGQQPMASSLSDCFVTFNGEIYNFKEIKNDLEKMGRKFPNHSDTLAIVEGYSFYKEKILEKLNGMFTFGIWDKENKKLILARDRFGIKPLYYMNLKDGGMVFSSLCSTVMLHPECTKKLDSWAIANYFFSDYVHPPFSSIQGIYQLPPGHFLSWDFNKKECTTNSYYSWQLPSNKEKVSFHKSKLNEVQNELRKKISDSVERQLVADVPVGIFLSGGIDSSVIAYEAAKKKNHIQTFSIGFEQKDFDESDFATMWAKKIGASNINRTLSFSDMLFYLDNALEALDSPLADPSIIPTTILSELAREHVKVVLGGDGGDELFAGYPTYLAHTYAPFYFLTGGGKGHQLFSKLLDFIPVSHSYQSLEWKIKRFVQRFDERPDARHGRWMSSLDWPDVKEAFSSTFGKLSNEEPMILKEWYKLSDDFSLDQFLLFDLKTYLPGSVLSKVDRASMGKGLEVRPPFLDNDLASFAFNLDEEYKFHGKTSKFILKNAYKGLISNDILFRKKKGFGIPLAKWIAGPLKSRLDGILDHSPLFKEINQDGPLSQYYFKDLLKKHIEYKIDASKPLWALLVLEHWRKRVGALV